MSSAPWWASGDDGGPDSSQDPLAAHLSARRGPDGDVPGRDHGGDPGRDHGGDPDPDEHEAAGDEVPPGDPARAGHDPAVCGVCPICRGWAVVSANRPDVADHLAEAARALASALTHLADAATAAADGGDREGRAGRKPAPGAGPSPGPTSDRSSDRAAGGFRPILLEDPDDVPDTGDADHPTDQETA